MDCIRIQTGATEQIVAVALSSALAPLTGLTDLKLMIRRAADGWSYDFADATFKSVGWSTRQQAMTEISASLYPGEYQYTWNTGAITNPTANDAYLLTVTQTPGTTVKNVPQVGELKVGQYVDKLDATVSSRAAPGAAMDLITDAVDAAALAADAVTEIQAGLATAVAVAAIQADTDDLQTRVPAALVGGRIDASVGAMAAGTLTAAAIATDAIDADALAADAVTEIQAGLATEASVLQTKALCQGLFGK